MGDPAATPSTARAFDAIAPGYDAAYGPDGNAIMAWLRAESLALLEATFPPEARLLEIGCGTGEEALHLARRGNIIVATDISPRMAAITAHKAQAAGLSARVAAMALSAAQIGQVKHSAWFDGAYASFGALNCETNLPEVASALDRLLGPGARFICSVMARFCPFEIAWFLAHAQPRSAWRRLKPGWQAGRLSSDDGSRVEVDIRYLSLSDLRHAFAPFWIVERSISLPLLLPPPYLDRLYHAHPRFWKWAVALEHRLREQWPWRTMGDHLAVVMRRPEL